ncbi:MAG: 6,7-dimethyl-8-ribityllumazine synthase [Candidatus Aminicenantes bacterium]
MEIYQGQLKAEGLKLGLILSRFNQFFSQRLLEGALDALEKLGAEQENIFLYKVPGSFEIPVVAKKLARSGKVDGILCLGALIRGDTPHFDYLSAEITKGLAQISMDDSIPVSYGIITVETIEQGIERSGAKAGNKGYDAAMALVETLSLIQTAKLK